MSLPSYIYTRIYPPAPLGAIRLRGILFQSRSPKSFQSFKSQVDSPKSFQSFKSPVDSQPVYLYTCIPVYLDTWIPGPDGICDLIESWFPGARMWQVTLPWVYYLSPGPPRISLKNHQISSLSPGPSKIRKSVPKVNKGH